MKLKWKKRVIRQTLFSIFWQQISDIHFRLSVKKLFFLFFQKLCFSLIITVFCLLNLSVEGFFYRFSCI